MAAQYPFEKFWTMFYSRNVSSHLNVSVFHILSTPNYHTISGCEAKLRPPEVPGIGTRPHPAGKHATGRHAASFISIPLRHGEHKRLDHGEYCLILNQTSQRCFWHRFCQPKLRFSECETCPYPTATTPRSRNAYRLPLARFGPQHVRIAMGGWLDTTFIRHQVNINPPPIVSASGKSHATG